MTPALLVVIMLSEEGDSVVFMELGVVPMKVFLVGITMAAEVDKMSAANVAVSAVDVFKNFDAVIVSRGGDVVLEYDMVV